MKIIEALFAVMMGLCAIPALAALPLSADEAKQLGGPELTLFGSEKAGNKDRKSVV